MMDILNDPLGVFEDFTFDIPKLVVGPKKFDQYPTDVSTNNYDSIDLEDLDKEDGEIQRIPARPQASSQPQRPPIVEDHSYNLDHIIIDGGEPEHSELNLSKFKEGVKQELSAIKRSMVETSDSVIRELNESQQFNEMSAKFKEKSNEAALKMKEKSNEAAMIMKEKSEEAAAKMKDIKEKMATKFKSFF